MSHLFSISGVNGTGPGVTHILSSTKTGSELSSPTGIADVFLWMDASDLSTLTTGAGGAVSYWRDKGPYGLHFQQSSINSQPTYLSAANSVGGNQCIRFTANGVYGDPNANYLYNISGSYFNNIQGIYTVFFFGKGINNTICEPLSMNSYDTFRRKISPGLYGSTIWLGQGPGDQYQVSQTIPQTFDNYRFFCWAPTSNTSMDFYYDNGVSTFTNENFQFNGTTPSNMYMGGSVGFGYNAEMTINTEFNEIILYNRQLSSTEINSVKKYLDRKYRLSLYKFTNIKINKAIDYNYLLVAGGGGGEAGGIYALAPDGGNGGAVVTGIFTSYPSRSLSLTIGAGGVGAYWVNGQYGASYYGSSNGSPSILKPLSSIVSFTGAFASGGFGAFALYNQSINYNNAGGNGNNGFGNPTRFNPSVNGTDGLYSTIMGDPHYYYWGAGGAGNSDGYNGHLSPGSKGASNVDDYGLGGYGISDADGSTPGGHGVGGAAVISYLDSQSNGQRGLGGTVSSYTDSGGNLWWVHLFNSSTTIKL